MAVLEIPELEVQLRQDDAAISSASDQISSAQHELGRVEAQHHVSHLQFERLSGVEKSKGIARYGSDRGKRGRGSRGGGSQVFMKGQRVSETVLTFRAQDGRKLDLTVVRRGRVTSQYRGI